MSRAQVALALVTECGCLALLQIKAYASQIENPENEKYIISGPPLKILVYMIYPASHRDSMVEAGIESNSLE